jgi:hypothetical protein
MFPLRELATTRIVEWAKSNWTSGNFPDVVQEIWRSTPPHENNLRDEIVEIVSTHVQYRHRTAEPPQPQSSKTGKQ